MVELIVHDLLLIQASPNSCKVDVYERTRGEGREFTSVSKGTWEELTNLCPEEIERDSVSCLEIRYNGTTPRKWVILILTTDGQKGDGIPGRLPFMERWETIMIAKEDEDKLLRRVVDYLERQDFGLQETLKLIFPTGQ